VDGPPDRSSPRAALLGAACLVALALLAHGRSLSSEFIVDDFPLILNNPLIESPIDWRGIFTTDYFRNPEKAILYRPLVIASFALNRAALGADPLGYHAVNVALHLLNTALVALAVHLLVRRRRLAFLAAAIFAFHPLHTEAIGCVFARTELLAALAQLGALVCWLRGRGQPRAALWAGGVVLCMALAMLAKESAVCLPGIIVAEGIVRRCPWRRVMAWTALAAAPVAVCLLWRIHLFGAIASNPQRPEILSLINPAASLPWWHRLPVGGELLMLALSKALWPAALSLDHSRAQIPTEWSLSLALWGAAGIFVLLASVREGLRHPRAARWPEPIRLGVAWFLVTWILVSNIVAPVSTIFAERLLYFPSIGLCLVAAWFADALWTSMGRGNRAWLAALILGAVAVLGISRSHRRHADLRDQRTAVLVTAETSPRSARALADAAALHLREGMESRSLAGIEEARELASRAVEIHPDLLSAWLALAQAEASLGNSDESRSAAERALALSEPDAPMASALRQLLDSLRWPSAPPQR
jgi:protein O-mannosyl-transferase